MAGAQKHSWEYGSIYTLQLQCWVRFLCLELILMCNTRDTNRHGLHHSVHLSSWLCLSPKVSPKIKSHVHGSNGKLYRSHLVLPPKLCKVPHPCRLLSLPHSSPTPGRTLSLLRLLLHPLLSSRLALTPARAITISHPE